MIKLVAFDWNGTLLADTLATYQGNHEVFKKFGHKRISLALWRDTFRVPILDFYMIHGWTRKEFLRHNKGIAKVFHEYYENRITNVRSRSGVRKTLEWLAKKDVEAIIFSNHTVEGIQSQLQRLGLDKYITKIMAHTELDGSHKMKSKEKKLAQYIKSQGLKNSEVLVVGDSVEEVEIGANLGIKSVSITGGYNSTKRLKSVNPNFLIHNMVELEKIISKLNRS